MKKALLLLIPSAVLLSACPSHKCGNGKVESGEACDDGNTVNGDGCESDCTVTPAHNPVCGNGIREGTEQCDDGNQTPGDGCENDCTDTPPPAVCGNGVKEAGEACDDGNLLDGDGCEHDCTLTPQCGNGVKEAGEQCDDGNQTNGDGCENDCTLTPGVTCGNGVKEGTEACDDGNTLDGDGCEHDCSLPFCGNGIKDMGEACDDGNTVDGDGCEADCSLPVCGNGIKDMGEACDDGNQTPGDGCENDCTPTPMVCGNGILDLGEACDDGNRVSGDGCEPDCTWTADGGTITCPGTPPPPPSLGTCSVTPGDGRKLITGVVLTPDRVLNNGQVLVDSTGTITCVGCNCDAVYDGGTASRLDCTQGVVSPGLINTHDHISYQSNPYDAVAAGKDPTERYEHRHDWRVGGAAHDNHTKISSGGNATNAAIRWAELRQVMSGTTSIVGATYSTNGNQGMLRNLDSSPTAGQEGLGLGTRGVNSETFPLNDTSGVELVNGCSGYPSIDTPSVIPTDAAYLPHISEGIEDSAHNEFRCTAALQTGGQNLMGAHTAIVHGIGLKAADVALMAATQTALVWSPRSNVSLYGDTAEVPMYRQMGVKVSLGMDWLISGSMNMLRELKCAQGLSQNHFNGAYTDEDLWRTATANSADITGAGDKIGKLKPGYLADVAIYRQQGTMTHGSVVAAQAADVVLTLRGGKVLYGDLPLVNAFDTAMLCEQDNICGTDKGFCVKAEYTTDASATAPARDLAGLKTANATRYPLYYCSAPTGEPSCDPRRWARDVKDGSGVYPASSGDSDGDGVPDSSDDCPTVFNPLRPMDHGVQADADRDGVGDACDPCPLDANTTTCGTFDPNDIDRDGVANAMDNCPEDPNPTQTDSDNDGIGDVCDWCPAPNANGAGCPVTIYDVKGSSQYRGDHVSLGNVLVTVVTPIGFYIQVQEGESGYQGRDNSAIFVYGVTTYGGTTNPPPIVVGDRLNISDAVVTSYQGEPELTQVGTVTNVSAGNALPALEVVTPSDIATLGPRAAALEGVLVQVQNLTVTDDNPAPGAGDTTPTYEYVVTGGLRVDDYFYRLPQVPAIGETFPSISGLLMYRLSNSKLEPRTAADYSFGPPVLAALEPALTFIREGSSGATIPSPLQVRLSRTWTSDLSVTVTSGGPEVTIADGGLIVVPAGQLTALVPVTGNTANDAGTSVSGTLLTTRNAVVRVLGAGETPRLVSLTPLAADILPGGQVTFTVALDFPPVADTPVNLALAPSGFGTFPATVTVPANQLTASFAVVADAMAMGQGTVTASLGGDMFSSVLNLRSTTTDHVVISEVTTQGYVDGGTTSNANDEFVELYNPTAQPVDIGGWQLQYKSAAGTSWTNKATIPGQTVMNPGGFYLITSKSYGSGVTPDLRLTTDLQLQATSGHVRIGLPGISAAKVDPLEVDRLGYGPTADYSEGGGHTAGLPNPGASFERKANPASTAASMGPGGMDALLGNGLDTDNNADVTLPDGGVLPGDFVIRAVRDPQNSNTTEP